MALLAIGGAGWFALQPEKPATAAGPTAQAGADGAPKVEVYELSGRDVASIGQGELRINLPLSGSLTPLAQATIKSKVSGVVTGATIAGRHARSPQARCWRGSTRPTSAPAWRSSRPCSTKPMRA